MLLCEAVIHGSALLCSIWVYDTVTIRSSVLLWMDELGVSSLELFHDDSAVLLGTDPRSCCGIWNQWSKHIVSVVSILSWIFHPCFLCVSLEQAWRFYWEPDSYLHFIIKTSQICSVLKTGKC